MKLRYRISIGIVTLIGVTLASLAVAVSYNAACPRHASTNEKPSQMKAVAFRCYGPPAVLEIASLEKPLPADDEVLVKVQFAGLNPLDWHRMRGEPYFMRLGGGIGSPPSQRLGVDFAGTVESVGAKVKRFKPGDAVFGGRSGAFAEYVTVAESGPIAHKPQSISFEQAAGIGIAALTALQGLRDHGDLDAGEHVLINGASGGVGTFAVQLAKAFGARVSGVCSTRNLELVRSLGADRVIDYTQQNFTQLGETYDLILDMVGTQPIAAMHKVLKPDGRLVIIGGTSRDPWIGPLIGPATAVVYSQFVDQQMGMFMARMDRTQLEDLANLMREGKVAPVVDRQFALEDIAAAMTYLETGRARGKVVVRMP